MYYYVQITQFLRKICYIIIIFYEIYDKIIDI